MATHIGIGLSQKLDITEAALEAANQAKTITGQSKIDLALVFSTIHYNPSDFLPVLRQSLKDAKIIGCSTAGIISSNSIDIRGISVLLISSDTDQFSVGSINEIGSRDMRRSGNLLARNVISDSGQHKRHAFVYFADGLLSDNSLILNGLQDVFGTVFPIIGAGSSDDFHFKKTYQFCQDKVMTNGAAGLLIGGNLSIGLGSRHGWKPLGKPRFVDKVVGNTIKIIDGKAAASIYDEYFGSQAKNLRGTTLGQMAILYPLGIYISGINQYLLRNAMSIDKYGGILCQGHVPEGSEIHIMISNREACIQAATDASIDAKSSLMGKDAKLIIIIESMARQKLLGRSAFQEVKAIKEIFDYTTPIIGMYSFGEVCPSKTVDSFDKIYLQNETITVLALG